MLIRLVGVKFSHLVNGVHQLDLFDPSPRLIELYKTMTAYACATGQRPYEEGLPSEQPPGLNAE